MIKFLRDSIFIMILTFLFMLALVSLPLNFEFLNPIQNVFQDFDMTDIVYSQLMEEPPAEDDIVIVNFGNTNRGELAQMIQILNKYEPKVIGIDAFFRRPLDPQLDSSLMQAFSETKNLVLISDLKKYNDKTKQYDSLGTSNPMFNQFAKNGFANLSSTGFANMTEFLTSRGFIPQAKVKGKMEYAFAVKLAQIYKPKAAEKFLARKNISEYINYKGNIGFIFKNPDGTIDDKKSTPSIFPALDVAQVMEEAFEPNLVKNKIIMIGFMGATLDTRSFDDKFYTPLNKNYVGKSTPDMYGLVVHANIVSMILDEQYINVMNPILNFSLVGIVTLLSVMLFSYFHQKAGFWFDAVTILMQLSISVLLVAVLIFSFHWYRLKVDINIALLAVILSGIMVEIYYGLFEKLIGKLKKKEKEKLNIK